MTFVFAVLFVLLCPALALAQAVPDPTTASDAFFDMLARAVAGGDWKLVAVLAVIGLTFLAKTYGSKIPGALGTFLASSRGGAILALVLSLLVALAPAIAGKAPWSINLVRDALTLGLGAIGGWVGVRRLLGVGDAGQVAVVTQVQTVPPPAAPAA